MTSAEVKGHPIKSYSLSADLPLLKNALSTPPLLAAERLMCGRTSTESQRSPTGSAGGFDESGEAYKPHKKFDAVRRVERTPSGEISREPSPNSKSQSPPMSSLYNPENPHEMTLAAGGHVFNGTVHSDSQSQSQSRHDAMNERLKESGDFHLRNQLNNGHCPKNGAMLNGLLTKGKMPANSQSQQFIVNGRESPEISHLSAMTTLKDKILRRMDSMENLNKESAPAKLQTLSSSTATERSKNGPQTQAAVTMATTSSVQNALYGQMAYAGSYIVAPCIFSHGL